MGYKIPIEEKLIPALFGGLAIFLVSTFLEATIGGIVLFASLGASTVILAEFPDTRMAKLKVVITSYVVAGIIGYFLYLVPNVGLAAGIGVFLAATFMVFTNNVHPPAAGATLAFIFYPREATHLVYLLLGVIALLVILKTIIYFYKKELHIKNFHHEFK